MSDLLGILIFVVALLCGGAILRLISRSRWLMVITFLIWAGVFRLSIKAGQNGMIAFGGLTVLLVIAALILPWLGRLRIVKVAKGSCILFWRRVNGYAQAAENAAELGVEKEKL